MCHHHPPSSNMPMNQNPRAAVTMDDVAQHAGVSLMTVSRALDNPSRVAQRTRDRIQASIDELNYVGSAFAEQLATGRTRLVAVVLPDLRNPAFARELQGLAEGLGADFQLVVAGNAAPCDNGDATVRARLTYRPAALVVHGVGRDSQPRAQLARCGVPIVELGSLDSRPIGTAVGYSNKAAGKAATRHLLAS